MRHYSISYVSCLSITSYITSYVITSYINNRKVSHSSTEYWLSMLSYHWSNCFHTKSPSLLCELHRSIKYHLTYNQGHLLQPLSCTLTMFDFRLGIMQSISTFSSRHVVYRCCCGLVMKLKTLQLENRWSSWQQRGGVATVFGEGEGAGASILLLIASNAGEWFFCFGEEFQVLKKKKERKKIQKIKKSKNK